MFPPATAKAKRKDPNLQGDGRGVRPQPSYAAALEECSPGGYENPDIVNVVCEKTRRFRDRVSAREPFVLTPTQAYAMTGLMRAVSGPELRVLDFGGACGHFYFIARAIIPRSITLRWEVVDTPKMARVASTLTTDELSFSSNLDAAAAGMGRIDLVHSSSTLQCTDRPLDYLKTIIDIGAPYILLNRAALAKGDHDVVTIHESMLSWNGPGALPEGFTDRQVRYPFVFPRESAFYRILGEQYDIAVMFEDRSGMFDVAGEEIIGLGLLAKRRSGKNSPS